MKKPFRRGSPIDQSRKKRWWTSFSNYRDTVLEPQINDWLLQFKKQDYDLAARILDSVEFITNRQIRSTFRSLLDSLPGWNQDERIRKGKWRFVAFSKSAGESGDTMIHTFRQATNLNGKQYNNLFIYKRDLLREMLGADDTVIFVDDFAGTGKQACDTWLADIQELLPEKPNAYLLLIACNIYARHKIEQQTGLDVIVGSELKECDNIFSPKCKHFYPKEKQVLLKYCIQANKRQPRGHGDCGFLIVFSHNCPNNSIPILHAYHPRWYGLFRRYD